MQYDSKKKEKIHRRLAESAEAHNQNWDVDVNGMCTDNNRNEFLPDVGVWFQIPTQAQRTRPIANQCPLPDVQVKVNVLNFAGKIYNLTYKIRFL